MQRTHFQFLLAFCVGLFATNVTAQDRYEPTWESLSTNALPEWVKDAKFGVYTHWGIYSVPAHGGPDYVRNLYEGAKKDAKGVFSYHTKVRSAAEVRLQRLHSDVHGTKVQRG